MPNHYAKGARIERRVCKQLEADGYYCIRAAGSHGGFDVVALASDIDLPDVRGISLKAGSARLSKEERAKLEDLARRMPFVSVEYWRVPDRKDPIIERITG
jgi:Holliday junction resolvase